MDETFYTKALKFLALRPRTEKEVRENLLKHKASKNQIDVIIEKLKKQKFLNDEEFAKWWTEQRQKFRPKSWQIIKFELQQKGINPEIIKNQELRIKSQEEGKSDLEVAKELVEKNLKKFQNLSKQQLYQKLGGFLGRRGFSYDVVKVCIDEVFGK